MYVNIKVRNPTLPEVCYLLFGWGFILELKMEEKAHLFSYSVYPTTFHEHFTNKLPFSHVTFTVYQSRNLEKIMQMVTDYSLNMGHIVSDNLMHNFWANFNFSLRLKSLRLQFQINLLGLESADTKYKIFRTKNVLGNIVPVSICECLETVRLKIFHLPKNTSTTITTFQLCASFPKKFFLALHVNYCLVNTNYLH